MTGEMKERVRAWLVAEGRDDSAADAAFREVFQMVPRCEPSPAFSGRLLARLAAMKRAPGWKRWDPRWIRPLTSVGAVLAGLAVLVVVSSMPPPGVSGAVRAWSFALANIAGTLTRTLDIALWMWEVLVSVGSAAQTVVATPWVSVALAVNCAVALIGFFGLRRLLGPREEVLSW